MHSLQVMLVWVVMVVLMFIAGGVRWDTYCREMYIWGWSKSHSPCGHQQLEENIFISRIRLNLDPTVQHDILLGQPAGVGVHFDAGLASREQDLDKIEINVPVRIAAFLVSPCSASSSEATRPSPPGGEGQTLRPKAQGLGEAKSVPNSF